MRHKTTIPPICPRCRVQFLNFAIPKIINCSDIFGVASAMHCASSPKPPLWRTARGGSQKIMGPPCRTRKDWRQYMRIGTCSRSGIESTAAPRRAFALGAALAAMFAAGAAQAQLPMPGSTNFDITGFIQEATLDPTCQADPHCGGSITVNGHVIVVPKEI